MKARYYVHDSQATTASHMRRNSAINPRYWIMDRTTNRRVDEYTTRDTARVIAADMNREERASR